MRMRTLPALLALTVAASLAGCSLLGASEPAPAGSPGGPEKARITVATLPTTDIVPLYLAIRSGYFAEEGLEVATVLGKSGSDCVAKMTSGEVDIGFSSYTPFFVAQYKNVAGDKGGIKLVADATVAGPGAYPVITVKGSPVQSVRDTAGARIAVTALNTMSHLMVVSQLKVNGIDPNSVSWVELPFPQMGERLASHDIDAAYVAEPHLQTFAMRYGAEVAFDTAVGPTANIPLTGYGATAEFVQKNPKTLAAFQRAMVRATEEASQNRATVNKHVQLEPIKVDENTAELMQPTTFVSSLDPVRIQRVVDLMIELGAFGPNFNPATDRDKVKAADMIVKPPTG